MGKRTGGGLVGCKVCGVEVYSYPSRPRLYCSKSCARTAANLTDKNPSFTRDIRGEKNPMFGRGGMPGEKNPMFGRTKERAPRWKGGRKIRRDGYVLAVAPDAHPHPSYVHPTSGVKYVLEHRLVMEQALGRYLDPEEVVHHRDENPSNNEIGNLEVFASQADHMHEAHGKP
jgi:hypothetical protein